MMHSIQLGKTGFTTESDLQHPKLKFCRDVGVWCQFNMMAHN